MSSLVYALPVYAGVPIAVVLILGYGGAAYWSFVEHAVILPVATPLLVLAPLALFAGLLGQYLLKRRRGQRISEAINYYLPEEIVRDLVENRLDAGKMNQVVYGTCLATDMAGSERLAHQRDPWMQGQEGWCPERSAEVLGGPRLWSRVSGRYGNSQGRRATRALSA